MADANQIAHRVVSEATAAQNESDFWDSFWDRVDELFSPAEARWILAEFGRLYDIEEEYVGDGKATARSMGRRGGLKGGHARAANMTPEERSAAARKAAQARWSK